MSFAESGLEIHVYRAGNQLSELDVFEMSQQQPRQWAATVTA